MSNDLRLSAIVFDWAGTTIDHGSCAPAAVFQEIFRRRGVPITAAQAREPMGRAKRDHIATVGRMPEVDRAWREQHGGHGVSDADIDAMYADFLPLQRDTLKQHSELIDGAVEIAAWCRSQGLKIGSTTGYTRELLGIVAQAAAEQGYAPDCAFGAEDAPLGRPAPFLLFQCAMKLQVYPMWTMIKVDDTPVGIEAGRNAGCWTIGVTRTGNGVGLSLAEWEKLDSAVKQEKLHAAEQSLRTAGAHFIVESVADLRPHIQHIANEISSGRLPF